MKEELMITKEDLVNWLNRPPSNDDLDLIGFITIRLENFYKLEQENKQLKEELETLKDGFDFNLGAIENIRKEKNKLEEKIDKAIEILKNEDYIDKLPYIDEETSDEKRVDYWFEVADKLDDKRLEALEILGDGNNE